MLSAIAPRGADRTRRSSVRALLPVALALLACGVLAGCGGTRQDAHEPAQTFEMQVLHASFPARQSIARPATMVIAVRNTGTETVPTVAVTINSFTYSSSYPELAERTRPIWVVERGPGRTASPPVQTEEVSVAGSGQTAYVDTWALGALAPGRTQVFTWHVVAVKPGVHVVYYSVAAGLSGKSKARASSGSLQGRFAVFVRGVPPQTYVDPNTGKVVTGAAPPPSSP